MKHVIHLQTFTDKLSNLTIIEKVIPFDIKRIFYIYGVDDSKRGGHRHHNTIQAEVCVKSECKIFNNDNNIEQNFKLNNSIIC
jgi:hypothetical protein